MTIHFKDYFSFDTFLQLREHTADPNKVIDHIWRDKYHKLKADLLYPAVVQFLVDLRLKDGRVLESIKGAKGYHLYYQEAWDLIISNQLDKLEKYEINHIIAGIVDKANFTAHYYRTVDEFNETTEEEIQKRYDDFTNTITDGNFDICDCRDDSVFCSLTGERFTPIFNNWNGELWWWNKSKQDFELAPPLEGACDLKIIDVEFSSDKLLVADWFRIEQFTKAVDQKYQFNINSDRGCYQLSEWRWNTHKFISVSVGNTCPTVYKHSSNLLVANLDDDEFDEPPKEFEDACWVCTDLWWVTMIEKEQLINLVATEVDRDEAVKLVDKYLTECDNYNEISIEPGKYRLYISGDKPFSEAFDKIDLSWTYLSHFYLEKI